MCRMKSMILLKDKVYCPNHNSHLGMLGELNIKDDNAEPDFVKIEIIPPDGKVHEPIEKWIYCVDQDFLPEWYIRELDEPRCRKALRKWAQLHIRTDEEKIYMNITKYEDYFFKNCSNGYYEFADNSNFRIDDCKDIYLNNGKGSIYKSTNIIIANTTDIIIKESFSTALQNCLRVEIYDSEIKSSFYSVIYAYGNSKINAGYGTIVIKLDPKVEVTKTDESVVIIERYNDKGII